MVPTSVGIYPSPRSLPCSAEMQAGPSEAISGFFKRRSIAGTRWRSVRPTKLTNPATHNTHHSKYHAFRLIAEKHCSIPHQKLIRIEQRPGHAGPGGQSFDWRISLSPCDKLRSLLRSRNKSRQLTTQKILQNGDFTRGRFASQTSHKHLPATILVSRQFGSSQSPPRKPLCQFRKHLVIGDS